METKKSLRANLEKDKSMNFLMGLIVGLAFLFVGFEWGESNIDIKFTPGVDFNGEVEEIEPSKQLDPPPPIEPEPVNVMEIINIVVDEMEVDKFDYNSEDDQLSKQIEVFRPPVEIKAEETSDDFIYVAVENMPVFTEGGEAGLLKWIAEHVIYPQIAIENNYQGLVSCQFVVNTDGSVADVVVLRPVNQYLDNEAIRVLRQLPKFTPGRQGGKNVRVKYTVPVRFKLQDR